ncbi:MAG: MoxR family ATPase [Acidobacteria bacterium]|nr:MoxR family ATPase [Acidobacteriota bacterium]
MSDVPKLPASRVQEIIDEVRRAVGECVLGQTQVLDALCAAFLAGGHALLEGVPGVGKTLLARCFSSSLGLRFTRLQFTPDLMPSDVLGTNVFDREQGTFRLIRGPVFTQVLMADEINRTPPKTQAALLEAMQERQASIDGTTLPLDGAFFVVATQNPLEFEGVYPLPEAQLDRFLLRIDMGLPEAGAEVEIYRRAVAGTLVGWDDRALPEPVVGPLEAAALRAASRAVHVEEELLDYLHRLASAVRTSPHVELGPSPRGALSLLEAGRAAALVEGRDFVLPDDLKRLLVPCWGHRLLLTAEAELEGHTGRRVLEDVAASVAVPH